MAAGATALSKKFLNGQVVALVFEIADEDNRLRVVKLPANVANVHDYLWNDYITSRSRPQKEKNDFAEQAANTAWKLVQDWIQVQVSMIKLKQMSVLEVFMPYLWDGSQTFYEALKENKFKALPAPSHE